MEIFALIDALEEIVVQARRLPVGGNLVVDRKRILDIIDQLRLSVPADLRQAQQVIEMRQQILDDARENARQIQADSQREREQLVDQTAVLREAHERSRALLMDAESRARQTLGEADATAAAHLSEAAEAAAKQLQDADQYALEVLRRLDTQLQMFLDSIRQSVSTLQENR